MQARLNRKNDGRSFSKASNRSVAESSIAGDMRSEIERILRVSDMLVTAHANLRGQNENKALALDSAILGSSIWLTSVVFVEPKIGLTLTPFHLDPQIWVGLLSISTLFLSVIQLRVDWKRQSDAHKRSGEMYSKIKADCRYLLESKKIVTRDDAQSLLTRYDMSADLGCPIPEDEFLKQKGKHLTKVVVSKFLDRSPASSITLLKIRLWWRCNVRNRKEPLA
jgi:hypothetical protein